MHQEIFNKLNELNISYKNVTHQKLFTVAESKDIDKGIDAAATKNLFLKDKKKNFYLITLPALKQVNLREIAKNIGAKGNNLSFANADYLKEILNLTPGSVTPFGLFYATQTPVKFILDNDLAQAESIGIHPMRNDMTTIITPNNLEIFLKDISVDYQILNI